MNLQEYFIKYNGKFLDKDGALGFQCTDVIKGYCEEVLNVPPIIGNAIDYWCEHPGFTRIAKGLFNRPLPGDILVWDIGFYGHVSICNYNTFLTVGVFEQNNPIGSPCHFSQRTYGRLLGWLHPNVSPDSPKPRAFPKVPLMLARVGVNLPPFEDFQAQVTQYSSNKISCNKNDYLGYSHTSNITQDGAYALVDNLGIKEKFVFIFYTPTEASPYLTSFAYPKGDCTISTIPLPGDPRGMAFEFAHQLTYFYNEHRGSSPAVPNPDTASNNSQATDELLKSKYDSVSKFYQ